MRGRGRRGCRPFLLRLFSSTRRVQKSISICRWCGDGATIYTLYHALCLKIKRNNFIKECLPYNRAVSFPEGKDAPLAISCTFFKQLIRASYKFPKENVFVSSRGFMHIGLLLTICKASTDGCRTSSPRNIRQIESRAPLFAGAFLRKTHRIGPVDRIRSDGRHKRPVLGFAAL